MTARSGGREEGERGGATLIGLALAGFVLLAGVAAVDVGALAGGRAAAQTAADLAALAALAPPDGSVVAPEASSREDRAAAIAAANGAELVACDCSAVHAVVSVRRRQRLLPGGLTVTLTARARALLAQPPPGGATGASSRRRGVRETAGRSRQAAARSGTAW